MPEWVSLGSSRGGFGMIVSFDDGIVLTRVNTALYPNAIDLEVIPGGPAKVAPGILLIYRPWEELYCLMERDGWTEVDYLNYAKKRLRELKMKKP